MVCGADISDRRPQARFCSSSCRALHHRGAVYLPAVPCEGCGAVLDRARADARFCGPTCRSRAWRASKLGRLATAVNGFHPAAKETTPDGNPDACTRCGSSASYRDEDGDLYCVMCGRLREIAPVNGGEAT